MKRTITIRVEVEDVDAYADAVYAITRTHESIIQSVWTRGEGVKAILEAKGMTVFYGHGAASTWIAKNS